MLEGIVVNKEEPAYKHVVKVNPIAHHYEIPGELEYVKYGCPVCEALEDHHTVTKRNSTCPICGVNLNWEENING